MAGWEARATLANDDNWLTIVRSDDLDGVLDFDAHSVPWIDTEGTYWDGYDGKPPPCLRVQEPATVEVSYVRLPHGGGVVTQVRCLSDH